MLGGHALRAEQQIGQLRRRHAIELLQLGQQHCVHARPEAAPAAIVVAQQAGMQRGRRGNHHLRSGVGAAVRRERQGVELHGARQRLVELRNPRPGGLHSRVVGRHNQRGGVGRGQQCGVEQQKRSEAHIGAGCPQGNRLAAPQSRKCVGLMRAEWLAGERHPRLRQLGVDRQVRDPLAPTTIEWHIRKQRRDVAAPALPSHGLQDLVDGLHAGRLPNCAAQGIGVRLL